MTQDVLVRKRDGRIEAWLPEKIVLAVTKAAREVGESLSAVDFEHLIERIAHKAHHAGSEVAIDDLHRCVELTLMGSKFKETARAYVAFRSKRDRERAQRTTLMLEVMGLVKQNDDDVLNQNANKASRHWATHRDLLAGILSKEMSKWDIPPHVHAAHEQGILYQHDRDYAMTYGLHNCGVYNYADMLARGFTLGNAKIATPRSVGVATTIISQIASTIGGSSYGGQSVHRYAELLLPYVKMSQAKLLKEQAEYGLPDEWVAKKLRKEVYDAHQTFIYQTNTICGANGQSAFLTISLYPSQDPLVRMITEEYFKCHMAGIGEDGRTPVFPKVIYFLEAGINLNPEDPNYDEFQLAMRCSAKRMYPDYVMAPNNRKMTGFPDVVTPMGCRSFVSAYSEDGKEKYVGRFNLGVITLNIPYAAAEAHGDKAKFFEYLKSYCDIALDAHMARIQKFAATKAKSNPIMWTEGALARLDPEDTLDKVIYGGNATASLGYIGVAEAQELCGDTSKEFAIEILKFLKNQTIAWKEQTGIAFSVYGTPAESLCYRFAKLLRQRFPELDFKHEYLTNSFHLPVRAQVNIFEKFGYESGFFMLSSGGNVNNVELPNMANNIPGLEAVIREAYDKVNYLIVNQPVDQCFACGFEGEFLCTENGFTCPECGNHDDESISVIRRVSGYISAPNSRPFNRGKQCEVIDRVKHFNAR